MKLNLGERFAVLAILPKETNFVTLKIVRDLQDSLAPSEKEVKSMNIRMQVTDQGTATSWDPKNGGKEVEIKIGEKAHDVISDALEELDKNKKLTGEHLTIYEKFVENKP